MFAFQPLLVSTLVGLSMANPVAMNDLLTRQANEISCPDMNSTIVISSGKRFVVECGIDHAGGDLPNQPVYVSGLAGCVRACGQTPSCVDFGLSGSACYMKGSVGPNVYGGANGARLLEEDTSSVYLTCGTVG
ncbi:hypothetical protein Slin15195_G006930 [Septoria linicola]|uniref:Apple domain-containing protein n=1 Tax=Septoria linicola TaxID=215465 RepID=A0A9Q9AD59_9PEZI|nr:hypothetical protein Slin14017_G006940 [Septoria linicola]USW47374.1 hypothetical protein Slin15195_G006930 [Septoria linicola]